MPLTDAAARNARPGEKAFKLSDSGGMYLLVKRAGKYWRFDYRFDGKRKTLALGVYPETSLKEARERRDAARKQLAAGIDPGAAKKAAKSIGADSFEAIAKEWHGKYRHTWTTGHADRIWRRLDAYILPWLGSMPIRDITAPDLLAALRRIEAKGALETAHRARSIVGQVMRYGIATGRAGRDVSADLRGALPPTREKHHASILDPREVGALLRNIDAYQGSTITRCAMQLAPLVFVRPGELRHAEWSEVDRGRAEWRIPAEKMKMRSAHIVPLSRQAIEIFREIQPLTGHGRYVFPSARSPGGDRPMSENAVLAALRRMGYEKGEMTGHGFRSIASTRLHEMGWPSDAIERQLAHAERDGVKAAYCHAEYLPERRAMMQAWADYLDGVRRGAEIVPIRA